MILTTKYVREKGIFVRETSERNQGIIKENFLQTWQTPQFITYFQNNIYCLQATKIMFLLSRIATFYTSLIQFWSKTRAVVTFKAKVKGVIFQKAFLGTPRLNPLHFSLLQYPPFLSSNSSCHAHPCRQNVADIPSMSSQTDATSKWCRRGGARMGLQPPTL